MNTRNNRTTALRDCEVWRVISTPDNKNAAVSPLCNSFIEQPYPLAVCKARHRVEAASSHLRDCEVCEFISTLVGKIGINVIYMYRVKSTLQTSQSRKQIRPDGGSSLSSPHAGTERREIPLGYGCWAYRTRNTERPETIAESPVFLASVQHQPCARRRQSGGRGVQLVRIPNWKPTHKPLLWGL
jgi:hypothetical protein